MDLWHDFYNDIHTYMKMVLYYEDLANDKQDTLLFYHTNHILFYFLYSLFNHLCIPTFEFDVTKLILGLSLYGVNCKLILPEEAFVKDIVPQLLSSLPVKIEYNKALFVVSKYATAGLLEDV